MSVNAAAAIAHAGVFAAMRKRFKNPEYLALVDACLACKPLPERNGSRHEAINMLVILMLRVAPQFTDDEIMDVLEPSLRAMEAADAGRDFRPEARRGIGSMREKLPEWDVAHPSEHPAADLPAALPPEPGGAIRPPNTGKLHGVANNVAWICRALRDPDACANITDSKQLAFNEMLGVPTLDGNPMVDPELTAMMERLMAHYPDPNGAAVKFKKTEFFDALERVAHERPYHPVRDWLTSLRWDGTPRLATAAARLLHAADPLSGAIFRRWCISAVARVMEPGCKVDTAMVFAGPEGFRKSSFFAAMAGAQWFCDTKIDIGSKDAYQTLNACWVLEWGELESVRGRAVESVKAFLSSRVDTYRPPYGRLPVAKRRHGVIVGSTNRDDFLDSTTGSRRYWIIPITETIDTDGAAAEREQLWAEALAEYRAGVQWFLTAEEDAARRERTEEYQATDDWESVVAGFVEGKDETQVSDILAHMGFKTGDWGMKEQHRVGDILRRMGWKRARSKVRRYWTKL